MLEREVKLAVSAGFRLPEPGELAPELRATPEEVVRHTDVYYDTEDLRLTRWGCGLRHRSDEGWTVKWVMEDRGPAVVRRELRFEGPLDAPPGGVQELVLAATRGRPLVPVAHLRTIRHRTRLLDDSGRALLELTDDRVAVLEEGRVRRRFREVEVELVGPCPPELLERVLARLREAGSGPAHRVAKYARALGLEAGVAPEIDLAPAGPDASAAEVVRLAVARSVDSLIRHDPGVRIGEEAEDLHQMRVATRRLRSVLRTFQALLDEAWAAGLRDRLKDLGTALGRVRDADVLHERWRRARDAHELDLASAKELLDLLEERRERDLARVRELLRGPAYVRLLEDLLEAAQAPRLRPEASGPAARVLPPLAWRRFKRLARSVKRLGAEPSEEELHGVRIRAKHTRYAAEVLVPVLGKPASGLATAARRLQQVLGEHQDAVVSAAGLRSAAAEVSRDAAFAAGVLAAGEVELARCSTRDWRRAWRRVRRRRPGGWSRSALSVSPG